MVNGWPYELSYDDGSPDEEIIFCSHCGGQNPKGAAYCQGCGKMLNP